MAKRTSHPVSESQRRWAFAAEDRGQLPKGKAMAWSRRVEGEDLPKEASIGNNTVAEYEVLQKAAVWPFSRKVRPVSLAAAAPQAIPASMTATLTGIPVSMARNMPGPQAATSAAKIAPVKPIVMGGPKPPPVPGKAAQAVSKATQTAGSYGRKFLRNAGKGAAMAAGALGAAGLAYGAYKALSGKRKPAMQYGQSPYFYKQAVFNEKGYSMNKYAVLEQIRHESFVDELEKISGVRSEMIGSLINPLNWAVGAPAAFIGALRKPASKKMIKEKQNPKKWSNILIPGLAPYRAARRSTAVRALED